MTQSQINEHLSWLEQNLDTIKDNLHKERGEDPGHDVGDASNIVELIMNLITQGHYDNDPGLFHNFFSEVLTISTEDVESIFESIGALANKPNEYQFLQRWITNLD